jgi:hypothetical protein
MFDIGSAPKKRPEPEGEATSKKKCVIVLLISQIRGGGEVFFKNFLIFFDDPKIKPALEPCKQCRGRSPIFFYVALN